MVVVIIVNNFFRYICGRYGIDELCKLNTILFLVIFFVNIFVKSYILGLTSVLLFITTIYRCFSKNIYRRTKENNIYLKIKKKLLKPFKNIKRNITDKENVYVRCNRCKTTLKLPLPKKRGFKTAICPECKNRVHFYTFKKQKIEIITKKGRKTI